MQTNQLEAARDFVGANLKTESPSLAARLCKEEEDDEDYDAAGSMILVLPNTKDSTVECSRSHATLIS